MLDVLRKTKKTWDLTLDNGKIHGPLDYLQWFLKQPSACRLPVGMDPQARACWFSVVVLVYHEGHHVFFPGDPYFHLDHGFSLRISAGRPTFLDESRSEGFPPRGAAGGRHSVVPGCRLWPLIFTVFQMFPDGFTDWQCLTCLTCPEVWINEGRDPNSGVVRQNAMLRDHVHRPHNSKTNTHTHTHTHNWDCLSIASEHPDVKNILFTPFKIAVQFGKCLSFLTHPRITIFLIPSSLIPQCIHKPSGNQAMENPPLTDVYPSNILIFTGGFNSSGQAGAAQSRVRGPGGSGWLVGSFRPWIPMAFSDGKEPWPVNILPWKIWHVPSLGGENRAGMIGDGLNDSREHLQETKMFTMVFIITIHGAVMGN